MNVAIIYKCIMSSNNPTNQQQTSPSVVQNILKSLAQCGIVNDEVCLFSVSSTRYQKQPTPRQQQLQEEEEDEEEQQQSEQQPQYDADRYLSRKLQIFRTTEEECLAEFGISIRGNSQQYSNKKNNRRFHRQTTTATDDIIHASCSDDEINNLTENQIRIPAHGMTGSKNWIVKLLRDPFSCIPVVQRQYNNILCHANPVRSTSGDTLDNIPDWKLTDEEYFTKQIGNDGSTSDRDETITSESYFDQKYAHINQVTPPMPLFDEWIASEYEKDALLKLCNRRQPASIDVINNRAKTSTQQQRSRYTVPRSSAADHIVSVITTTPRRMKESLSIRAKKVPQPQTFAGKYKTEYDTVPTGATSVPQSLADKHKTEYDTVPTGASSSELSSNQSVDKDSYFQSPQAEHQHQLRFQPQPQGNEPDGVHYTFQ
jgi:hypothetical protein